MWLLSLLIGCLGLSVLWYIERTSAMTFFNWGIKIIPIVMVSEIFFWFAFNKAPNWILARYTMSAMTNTFGLIMAIAFLHEGMGLRKALGIAMIIAGGFLLK